jgi:toxin ParE1/3/4
MTFSVSYLSETYDDLKEITQWYTKHRKGLDGEFLLSLEAVILHIKRNPFQLKEKLQGVREVLLKRFPYRLIFKTYNSKIIVIGILHTNAIQGLLLKDQNENKTCSCLGC